MATTFRVVSLGKGEAQTIRSHQVQTLKLVKGSLWLTTVDDPRDYFLNPGECFVLHKGQEVVVESEDQSQNALATFTLELEGSQRKSRPENTMREQICIDYDLALNP